MAACFLECVDHIEYAVAFAGSEVVNGNALVVSQFLDGFYMAACQVNNMDVIADTSSVRSIVVITENADALEFSDGNLCDIRKQVVRDALRILSDKAALMRSDRIEVTKQDNIPFRICGVDVGQNLLEHAFCPAVWVGRGSLRALLGDRNLCRIAVYGCRRTEDDVLYAVVSHLIAENQGSGHVVVIIFNRFMYGLADCF